MRLIDADALCEECVGSIIKCVGIGCKVPTMPTIEAEPVRHGRWEWKGGIPWCSNCGEMPPGYSYDGDVNTTPYCPNCGAKMDLEG